MNKSRTLSYIARVKIITGMGQFEEVFFWRVLRIGDSIEVSYTINENNEATHIFFDSEIV